MSTTAQDIITKAFRKCGILTMNQTPTSDMVNDALDALNDMLASWAAQHSLLCYARKWETFTLTGGTYKYTMGSGGNFNTTRPVAIVGAYVTVGNADLPVKVIPDVVYNEDIIVKSAPGVPNWLAYDNAYPLCNIVMYPSPAGAYPLFLLSEKALSSYALTDTVDLPPGWERAIVFNLPNEIAGDYGQDVPQIVQTVGAQSKAALIKQVSRTRSLDANPQPSSGGNIYTGWAI